MEVHIYILHICTYIYIYINILVCVLGWWFMHNSLKLVTEVWDGKSQAKTNKCRSITHRFFPVYFLFSLNQMPFSLLTTNDNNDIAIISYSIITPLITFNVFLVIIIIITKRF